MTPFRVRVESVVAGLAPGEVVTYGEVAAQAGSPGAARGVGSVLRSAQEGALPWWRVVGAGGRLVSPSATEQARLLTAEGVAVVGRRVLLTGLPRAVSTALAAGEGGGRDGPLPEPPL